MIPGENTEVILVLNKKGTHETKVITKEGAAINGITKAELVMDADLPCYILKLEILNPAIVYQE